MHYEHIHSKRKYAQKVDVKKKKPTKSGKVGTYTLILSCSASILAVMLDRVLETQRVFLLLWPF
jgi:hypothetical protein